MKTLKAYFDKGGYGERNQLQEDSGILCPAPQCGGLFECIVQNGKESQLAKSGGTKTGISVSGSGGPIHCL